MKFEIIQLQFEVKNHPGEPGKQRKPCAHSGPDGVGGARHRCLGHHPSCSCCLRRCCFQVWPALKHFKFPSDCNLLEVATLRGRWGSEHGAGYMSTQRFDVSLQDIILLFPSLVFSSMKSIYQVHCAKQCGTREGRLPGRSSTISTKYIFNGSHSPVLNMSSQSSV